MDIYQSMFFTNFTNRNPYFHIYYFLSIYFLEENKSLLIMNDDIQQIQRYNGDKIKIEMLKNKKSVD